LSDAARLASLSYQSKPSGLQRTAFHAPSGLLAQISVAVPGDLQDSAYSAAISYAEALVGIRRGNASWAVVKLYYSCFYSIKTLLIADNVIPFNFRSEYLLDISANVFEAGGRSSHHWNWNSFQRIRRLTRWVYSADSESAYNKMREHREHANYTHPFTDPVIPSFLLAQEADLGRRVRSYRDDAAFFFTYLPDHMPLAYATKLIFELDQVLATRALDIGAERKRHLRSLWPLVDRCPIAT
jgi:hypothetical protein